MAVIHGNHQLLGAVGGDGLARRVQRGQNRSPMRLFLLLLLLVPTTACWNPRYFTPRERVDAAGPDGMPAALYTVPAAAADMPSTAELRVWSQGAKARYTDDDREIAELHVGFELENNGASALRLVPTDVRCEEVLVDGLLQEPLLPVQIVGDGVAAAGQTARLDLVFELPTDTPRDLDSFAVRFAVLDGDQERLRQVTPFGPWVQPVREDRYWGAWGFGFGLGWHGGGRYCR